MQHKKTIKPCTAQSASGYFTNEKPLPERTVLFPDSPHGAVMIQSFDVARHADVLIGISWRPTRAEATRP
jgi:phosphoribulokinase